MAPKVPHGAARAEQEAMTDDNYISLFDSTLRDGAQTQGVDFSAADNRPS